jgi:hypothetical protein
MVLRPLSWVFVKVNNDRFLELCETSRRADVGVRTDEGMEQSHHVDPLPHRNETKPQCGVFAFTQNNFVT